MNDVVTINDEDYYTKYTNKSKINYSTSEKGNIGYILNNELTSYIKTTLFSKKKTEKLNHKDSISYNSELKNENYTSKLHLPNMYDLFGASIAFSYWYGNYSSDSNTGCVMTYDHKIYCGKYNRDSESGVRLVGYFNKQAIVKSGKGTIDNPYTVTK